MIWDGIKQPLEWIILSWVPTAVPPPDRWAGAPRLGLLRTQTPRIWRAALITDPPRAYVVRHSFDRSEMLGHGSERTPVVRACGMGEAGASCTQMAEDAATSRLDWRDGRMKSQL